MSSLRMTHATLVLSAALLMLAGTASAELVNWSIDSQAEWGAGSFSNTNANGGTLRVNTGRSGSYVLLHDFGSNVDLQRIKVASHIVETTASASMQVWVSDLNGDQAFANAPSKTMAIHNGVGQDNELDFRDLPSKRFMKLNITLANTTSDSPEIYYFQVNHTADNTAPTTVVQPTKTGWLKDNQSFVANCTDTGGSGCNQTYYKAASQDVCGAKVAGYWSFDDATASSDLLQETFNDIDGVRVGSASKPTPETTSNYVKSGKSLSFDGNSGGVMIEDKPTRGLLYNPLLNSERNFSIEMWVLPKRCVDDSGTPVNPYLISKWWSDTETGDYIIQLDRSTCKPVFTVANNQTHQSGFWMENVTSGTALQINNWNFLVATFNNREMRIYVNGQLAAPPRINDYLTSTQAMSYPYDDIYVGSDYLDGHNFNGYIDEVRIYDSQLSPEEIAAHYRLEEFWLVASAVGTQLKPCGLPPDSCEFYAEGEAGCPYGKICTLRVCAYSKDGNGNVEDAGTPKQTYMIDKGLPNCSIDAASRNPSPFNITVNCSSGATPVSITIENSTDGMSWQNASDQCTRTSGSYPAWNYTCAMANGTVRLRANAIGLSGTPYAGQSMSLSVDTAAPACAINASGTGTEVEANWTCIDTGSGMASVEAQANLSGGFAALSSFGPGGCNVTQSACSGSSCVGNATCNASFTAKEFRVRGTDGVGNVAAWANQSGGTDADGDRYPAGTGAGMDCNDTNANIHPGAYEYCDGVDNDCDGVVDQPWLANAWNLTKACSVPGMCAGVIKCNATGTGTYCDAKAKGKEICGNAIDDDCDGTVDEEFELVNGTNNVSCDCVNGTTRPCPNGTGVCVAGVKTCLNGVWGECAGRRLGTEEMCKNGIDDDCDGQVDELECVCRDGDTKVCGGSLGGACKKGTAVCESGVWSDCIGEVRPTEEICGDKIDNDCDGEIDEAGCSGADGCSNGKKDAGEDGVDCGGDCPDACPEATGIEGWMLVAIAAVIIIAMTGLVAALGKG